MGSADELVDVVDEHDVVVGVTTRGEMRAQRLRHRSVFVLVRSSAGDVLVHRRSEEKDVWPGRWDLAAGGVLASGESYADGARRELAEELGVTDVMFQRLGAGRYEDDAVSEVSEVYGVTWDGAVRFADGEVVEARWVTPSELVELVATAPFVPDSIRLVLPHVPEAAGAPYAQGRPTE